MEQDSTLITYVISNIVAIGLAVSAMLWRNIARALYSIVFLIAALVNSYTLFHNPKVYLVYGELTSNLFYRSIILGPFSKHIVLYVGFIALSQFLIGVFSAYKGNVAKIAMYGGILFLIAIAPLGIGSAFPASLILATGYFILVRKKFSLNLFEAITKNLNYSRLRV